jgi:hypothetical protein
VSVIKDLRQRIEVLQREIDAIQDGCSHPTPAVTKTHRCDDDEYGTFLVDSRYSTQFRCGLCDKYWTEEGSK